MEMPTTEILKWVGLVFAAGFISYFGRYLSMLLLERVRRKKQQQSAPIELPTDMSTSQADRLRESRLKVEKKRAKAEAKKAKKEKKQHVAD